MLVFDSESPAWPFHRCLTQPGSERCAPSGASNGFYRIDTKDANLARDGAKYMGAVAVGTCVYFVPYQVSKVGVICCDGGD